MVSSLRVLAWTRSLYGAEGTLILRKIVFGDDPSVVQPRRLPFLVPLAALRHPSANHTRQSGRQDGAVAIAEPARWSQGDPRRQGEAWDGECGVASSAKASAADDIGPACRQHPSGCAGVAHEGPGTMQASAHRPFGHATKSHTLLPGRAPQGGPENAGLLLRTCSRQGPYVGSVPKGMPRHAGAEAGRYALD